MIKKEAFKNGNYWIYNFEKFFNDFQNISDSDSRKQLINNLFDLKLEKNIMWWPESLKKDPQNKDSLILTYKVAYIYKAAVIEDLDRIKIGPSSIWTKKLLGFHMYKYTELPIFNLFLNNPNSYIYDEKNKCLILQLNKNNDYLRKIFAQVILKGLNYSQEYAKIILELAKSYGWDLKKKCNIAIVSNDADLTDNKYKNFMFITELQNFITEAEMLEELVKLIFKNAIWAPENNLGKYIH